MNNMNKIQELRLKKGMTAIEFAKKAGITNISLSLFENGKRKPSKLSLYKIAKALEVDPSDLQE